MSRGDSMTIEAIEVAVIIVTFRSAQLTVDCLRTVERERETDDVNIRCVVVDNASGDGPAIAAAIEANDWSEWVMLIESDRNGGFAYGNNRGIDAALQRWQPKYLHLLNPDTLLEPGAISQLVQFLEATPGAGIAGGAFKNGDGSDWKIGFRFPSLVSEMFDGVGLGPVNTLAQPWRVAVEMGDRVQQVDWVSGASMMVCREVFHKIGGMDEEFFLYFEETEFCFRAKQAGYSVWYVPKSLVVHLAGQSTSVTERNIERRRLPSYWFNSRRRYFARTHGILYSIAADFCAILCAATAAMLHRLRGKRGLDTPHYVSDLFTRSLLWTTNGRADQKRSTIPRFSKTIRTADTTFTGDLSTLGVVIIGRNEGTRLVRCIHSVSGIAGSLVYVDSGSVDESVATASTLGADVVLLDTSIPFTAARARNAGFRRLVELRPDVEFVQFVDGDCEVVPGWIEAAMVEFSKRAEAAVVCGRRRERNPKKSIYNQLCDIEWDTPIGEAAACGGDALFRRGPLEELGGYADHLIAGEEPELCSRLRAAGWKIFRIDQEMTAHDAAMTRLSQWWRRAVRAGFAYAAVSRLSGPERVRIWTREFASNWLWGLVLPVLILVITPFLPWVSLILMAGYPVLGFRIYRWRRRQGDSARDSRLYAFFCVLAKFPLVQGQLSYYRDRMLGRTGKLIEYKGAEMLTGKS